MAIQRVWIEEGCIVCKLCEETCGSIFSVGDENVTVKTDADLAANEDAIKEAAANCPVEIIKYE